MTYETHEQSYIKFTCFLATDITIATARWTMFPTQKIQPFDSKKKLTETDGVCKRRDAT